MNDNMNTNDSTRASNKNPNTHELIGKFVSWKANNVIYTGMVKCLVPKGHDAKDFLPENVSKKRHSLRSHTFIISNDRYMVQIKMKHGRSKYYFPSITRVSLAEPESLPGNFIKLYENESSSELDSYKDCIVSWTYKDKEIVGKVIAVVPAKMNIMDYLPKDVMIKECSFFRKEIRVISKDRLLVQVESGNTFYKYCTPREKMLTVISEPKPW